jgi:hypothetical protein
MPAGLPAAHALTSELCIRPNADAPGRLGGCAEAPVHEGVQQGVIG